MSDNGRCECGSRIFLDLTLRITCEDGRAFNIPSAPMVKCVSCGLDGRMVGDEPGRKEFKRVVYGQELERDLFQLALKDWENKHTPERSSDLLTTTEGDRLDFERLGLKNDAAVA